MQDLSQVKIASLKKRILGFIIDDTLISFLFIFIYFDKVDTTSFESIMISVESFILPLLLMKLIYQTFFTYVYGASIGKMFVKIKIICDKELNKPNLLQAFYRSSIRTIGEFIFYINFIFAFFDKFHITLHDKFSNTIVVDA